MLYPEWNEVELNLNEVASYAKNKKKVSQFGEDHNRNRFILNFPLMHSKREKLLTVFNVYGIDSEHSLFDGFKTSMDVGMKTNF